MIAKRLWARRGAVMATGYTFNVVDGQITTLSDFAMQCARAFGLLIDMRDAPSDAPMQTAGLTPITMIPAQ